MTREDEIQKELSFGGAAVVMEKCMGMCNHEEKGGYIGKVMV